MRPLIIKPSSRPRFGIQDLLKIWIPDKGVRKWQKIYFRQELLIPSLMFSLFEKLFVLVLAHLLFSPFYYVPHRLTSFVLFPIFFYLVHKGLKLNFCCKRFCAVIRNAQAGYAVLSLETSH
jgi:hypothetical protein